MPTPISTALTELVRLHGEDEVLQLLDGLRDRIRFGEFRADRGLH